MRTKRPVLALPLLLLGLAPASAEEKDPPLAARNAHLSCYGEGAGPFVEGDGLRLLDAALSRSQNNAAAFDAEARGARGSAAMSCRISVKQGGEGGAILFLSTAEYGVRGAAPFVRDVSRPELRKSFAVGIDVHEPKNEEPFGEWGNYQGAPERLVSLCFDGREIVKRVAPAEFRGVEGGAPCEVSWTHVPGGAEVTVSLAGAKVYDRHFVAGMDPYECRLAFAAGTRADAATEFAVRDVRFRPGEPAAPVRAPIDVQVFNHVLTDNKRQSFDSEVELPPAEWAFGRVLMTIEIHDAGELWDEWDRCGEVYVWDKEGKKRGIVPFITSYRTPCRWVVDVTHFRPWLSGRTKLEIEAGTNFYKGRGYMMSASLSFHHGQPGDEAFRILPLWNGTARYRSDENRFADFFAPVEVAVPPETTSARVFCTTTGHSQVGEFTPSKRAVVFTPDVAAETKAAHRHESVLWRDDCWLNPNRPQYGTWKYSRAGWAPGDVVHPWWIDLTGQMAPGKTASLRYEPSPYEDPGEGERPTAAQKAEASHNVRSYLILSRAAKGALPAPTARIINVVDGGVAAKLGVKVGDWLESYDGRRIETVDDLREAIGAAQQAGKQGVPVVVWRGAEKITVTAPPGRLGIGLSVR
ncbi:MAG: hypothetical protein HMLKMBBP_00409 [Planctomycetes bacterium]|nr:hypothetical protein [Planctomycetota bacterium]